MANKNEFWGLEIGGSAVKALKLERVDETSVRMIDFAVVQHQKVLSTPDVNPEEVIRLSLQQLTSQFDLTKGGLAVSVPGNGAFARFCKLPPVEPKNVPDIVRFEASQQIPVTLDEVEWDYQTFISPDSPDVGVGIFAMRKDNLKDRLQVLADFGLTPEVVTLSPLGVYNALAYDLEFGPTTPGTILVDIGTTSTDIVIAEPGRMWIRTFPMGGHQFTEAIVQAFNLSYPKAEKLKREAEQTEHARRVFQEMRPVFTDLATEIQRSIGYYQSLHKDAKLTRIIGVGSTFRLPGLRKYFKQQLGLEVYRVEEFKRIKPPANMPAERIGAFNELSLTMGTAYGLCLQGLGLNACGGNLMPVAVTRDAIWKEKVPWFAAAAGVAVVASAAFFGRPLYDSARIKGVSKDPVIQQAVAEANRLKTEAKAAGVVEGPGANYSAANMLDLTSRRDILPRITADLGEIFDSANKALPEWLTRTKSDKKLEAPAYALTSFVTTYESPEGEAGTSGSDADLMKLPRIRCTLELNTDVPEARRFASDTVGKWLEEHKSRDGVPYKIVYVSQGLRVTEKDGTTSVADATPPVGAGRPVGEGVMRQPERPAPTRGGRQLRNEGGPGFPPPSGGFGSPPPMGEGGGGDMLGTTPDDPAALQKLNEVAPIDATIRATGGSKIVVEWYAVVVSPAKEGGAQ